MSAKPIRERVPEKNAKLVALAERADRLMEKRRRNSHIPVSLADLEHLKNLVHEAVELGHKARFLWLSADERADNLTQRVTELRAELEPYEVLNPQQCPKGLHADWLVDSEHTHACPWCRIDELRAAASGSTAGDEQPETSPWQRAVDGLNALADSGVPFHIEPDGHISNPFGDEHIEWDRAAERWRLVLDDEEAAS